MTRAPALLALAALLAGLSLSGCGCGGKPGVPDAAVDVPDAGEEPFDAGLPDAGGGEVDAGQPDAGPPPELTLRRLLPPRGVSAGGTVVVIEGSGFIRDFATSGTAAKKLTTLKFGANPVLDYTIIDDETLELRAPPGVAGATSVTLQNPLGKKTCNNCYTYYDDLVVTAMGPKQGPLAGGTLVTLDGHGFTPDTRVLVGGRSSPQVTVLSPDKLTFLTPRVPGPDLVDVVTYDKNGTSTLRRAFRYLPEPGLTRLVPPTGPVSGGNSALLEGQGFTGASALTFGGRPATFSVVDDAHLFAEVPPGATVGAVAVEVTTPGGKASLQPGYAYVDQAGPFALYGVAPRVVAPGERVTLLGQGLDTVTSVALGGQVATLGPATATTLEVTVPARAGAPRVSDVTALSPGAPALLTGGVTWRMSLASASPASGPADGGTPLTVVGGALPAGARFFVGALEGVGAQVSSETDATLTTPPGSGGAASDLVAFDPAEPTNRAVLSSAFTYEERLALGRVAPERGAIAGGTLVTVLGAGFGPGTVVDFGAARAKDVKIVDAHTLTCRTPKGDVGTVDVRVGRAGASDLLPGGYSYFDPRSISGGLSGGPLVGTLNVTVLESTQGLYGAPVPLADVMLGADATTPFQGVTDARGQLTLSDPSLVKAQTVTVSKAGYQATTVTAVNAENLTVFIARTGGGSGSPGAPPPGVPPSVIAGRVTGFKSPRPLAASELLEARVFVAQTSLFGGPPFGGPASHTGEKWQVRQDGGDFLVYTRSGLRAVYAVLGILNRGTMAFTPVAMGVKRGITTSPDNPATSQDIVIDMWLDLTVPITIDSPLTFPGQLGPEPGTNRVYAWLDLGAEGFIPNPDNWDTGAGSTSLVSGATASLVFPHFPQLDGSNFIFLNESSGAQSYPVSYYFRRQPGDLRQGVTIGPMLPGPIIVKPGTTFDGTISWTVDPGPAPDIHDVQVLKPTLMGNVVLWEIVMPGTETQVTLPPTVVQQLRDAEAGNSLMVVVYSSRSPKFAWNQWTYDSLTGVTWSSFTIALSGAFTP